MHSSFCAYKLLHGPVPNLAGDWLATASYKKRRIFHEKALDTWHSSLVDVSDNACGLRFIRFPDPSPGACGADSRASG
jgi:hypothetical protein